MFERGRRFSRSIVPPIIATALRKLTNQERERELFWGDSDLFCRHLERARAYGEYGCGLSTIWVAFNTDIPILSVDTSEYWIERVGEKLGDRGGVQLRHIDLGELGDWGRPLSYARRGSIKDYVEAPWCGGQRPDVVLIDGRFRVACFFASLINAEPGCVILFDDYTDRPGYHLVEEYVTPDEICGRQAAFIVPTGLPIEQLSGEYERFLYVMD